MSEIICWVHEIREADCPKCMAETRPTTPAPVEHGRVHTGGSHSGGQPIGTNAPVDAGEVWETAYDAFCDIPKANDADIAAATAIISAAITAAEQRGAESERGKVVGWLRADACTKFCEQVADSEFDFAANAIETGAHDG